ncbi:hypothetical protein AQJ43_07285 [Streptomyces avermitilis]|uniref:Secreted protein n=1 Tax=Streptomyces avermitilis (strain ATCC 31267 / DSM 46492 / JCM 5070 / NBRC 14893 / NCIMB 12804 / NRRL 8165 / MA-4680) TaxID=227882 RepID=Q82M17_STRAW|nr:DUF5005 domain-containing protein [Streptomyces avermitilis]KUN55876.1 hypothetical protein AQJ43_07285 [Streptomyces avermitilis]MYS97468.1 DUF5005 domain-containing protein [Streptomyces sp. SID5469]OOV25361.1 hypothetical protein SM007_26155 [Streptomyces avermitilis]BAC69554.1 putative secreted protein [Streptomyces avermitilis MA-4680 = NBRC 14893]
MPDDARARRRTGTGLGVLLALVCTAVLLTALPDHHRESGGCAARTVESWRPDTELTGEFARYGDDATRADDWTGGDGTHSVRLPDGRVLWLFSDTYLGQVHGPPNPVGESYAWRDTSAPLVRNSAVVMTGAGRLSATLPAPLFPDPAAGQWRWPVAARVEPRSPGSSEQVVRVLLWTRTTGAYPWIYGVPTATEVATLSLPDLRVEGITQVLDQRQVPDPAHRVLFGTTAVTGDGDWTYVFGGDDGQAASRPASKAYVARVPRGRLAEPGAWEYWDGSAWRAHARPAAMLGDGRGTGVGSAFTVVRDGPTYVLFTMAAGTRGLTTVTSYWACSPAGPWHGPARGFSPPLPQGQVAAYNPQAHPVLGGDGRLVLSYDVNWLDTTGASAQANLSRNVSLYRPRFVSLRLTPG